MSVERKTFISSCNMLLDKVYFIDVNNDYAARRLEFFYNTLKYYIQFAPSIDDRKRIVSNFEDILCNKGILLGDYKVNVRSKDYDPKVANSDMQQAVMQKVNEAIIFIDEMYHNAFANCFMSADSVLKIKEIFIKKVMPLVDTQIVEDLIIEFNNASYALCNSESALSIINNLLNLNDVKLAKQKAIEIYNSKKNYGVGIWSL